MSFRLDHAWVWDFWLADDGEQFHLFYLHAPKSLGDPELRHRNARFGHAVSDDLTEWRDLGPIFEPGAPGDFDETATWTGSVLRGPDGLWRMFYTGASFLASGENVETIGVASSRDLHEWVKHPGPLTRADPRWYETLGDSSWPEEAWRDPWVFADPGGDGWHMLVTARAASGEVDDRGVVGHATSPDLESWTVHPPLTAPGAGFGHLEVLQVVEVEGRPVLLFSCDEAKLADARRAGGAGGGVWAVPIASATGPYAVGDAEFVTDETFYSGRIVHDRSGAAVMLAFDKDGQDGDFVGAVSDPLPVGWLGDRLVLLRSAAAREAGVGREAVA